MEKSTPVMEVHPKVMNIYEKIQLCRVGLNDANLKMTGKNTYSNYEYFELSDFLPTINRLAAKYKLSTIFNYTNEEATLTVINVENLQEQIVFTTPVEVTALKGCGGMQNIGGAQTFARRYLYVMAFEVSEPDTLNNGEKDEDEQLRRAKIAPVKVNMIKKMIKELGISEASYLKYFKIKSVEDINNGMFNDCLKALNDKKKDLEKEKQEKLNPTPKVEEIDF